MTRAALQAAREGQGPTFIEAFTYRMGAHTTSDDPTRYRLAGEVEEWKLRDPIARLKAYLSRSGLADAAFFEDVEAEADRLAARIRSGTVEMPDPPPTAMFDTVYAAQTPPLDWPWYGIGFGAAVKRFFKKYATFSGRASRGEYEDRGGPAAEAWLP